MTDDVHCYFIPTVVLRNFRKGHWTETLFVTFWVVRPSQVPRQAGQDSVPVHNQNDHIVLPVVSYRVNPPNWIIKPFPLGST